MTTKHDETKAMITTFKDNKIAYKNIQISNFFDKYKDIKRILGPSGVVMYKINDNIPIIFFQDVHEYPEPTKCKLEDTKDNVWIDDFFKELFKISPQCIDFFIETTLFQQLESPYSENDIKRIVALQKQYSKENMIGLKRIQMTFIDCIGPVKTSCQNYNVRFHNIEFRKFFESRYNLDSHTRQGLFHLPLFHICTLRNNNTNKNRKKITSKKWLPVFPNEAMPCEEENIDDTIKKYMQIRDSVGRAFLIGMLKGNTSLMSQAANRIIDLFKDSTKYTVSDDFISLYSEEKLIKSQYMRLHKQIMGLPTEIREIFCNIILEKYDANLQLDDIKVTDVNEQNIRMKLDDWNLYFGALFIDAYTLARILKVIHVYKNPSIICVYAGEYHVNFYIELLEKYANSLKLKFKSQEESSILNLSDNACINFENDKNKRAWKNIIDTLISTDNLNKCEIHPLVKEFITRGELLKENEVKNT